MKKRVLMIGDTSDLQGVSVDIHSYYDFFTSPVGGNWCNDEIEILESPTKRQLFKRIDEMALVNRSEKSMFLQSSSKLLENYIVRQHYE